MKLIALPAVAAMTVLAAGCESIFGGDDGRPVAGVQLELDSVWVFQGETATLNVQVLDAEGRPIEGREGSVTWSSSNPVVATVANGVMTTGAPGTAWIRATIGAFADSVHVTVTGPAAESWSWESGGITPRRALALPGGGAVVPSSQPHRLWRWDGGRWQQMPQPTGVETDPQSAPSASDVWAIGSGGQLLHWDGSTWSTVSTGATEPLNSVWAASATIVYASATNGAVYRFDGSSWTRMQTPVAGTVTDLTGTGPNDVWAIGAPGAGEPDTTVGANRKVLHWNGTSWTAMYTGSYQEPEDIWAASPTEAWVIGNDGALRHWNGAAWTQEPISTPLPLRAIWGSSRNDVYVVGVQGLVLRYNGTTWTELPRFRLHSFSDVHGTGPNNVYLTGSEGTLFHFDGTHWRELLGHHDLNGIWGTSPNALFAVGGGWFGQRTAAGGWRGVPAPLSVNLQAVHGTSATDVVAVGTAGTILHYDGTTASAQASGTTADLRGVWAVSPTLRLAVGNGGTILRGTGAGWTALASGTTADLVDVWASGATNAYAVGGNAVLRWDGASWAPVSVGMAGPYLSVYGRGANDVYVSGAGGLARFDGAAWTVLSTQPGPASLWIGEGGVLYGVRDGRVVTFSGTGWTLAPDLNPMRALWGLPSGEVWAAGMTLSIYHGTP